jgi:hypothetical protein
MWLWKKILIKMQTGLRRNFSQWLSNRLAQTPKHKTVALLVDKSEIATLECIKPQSDSEHFRQDLTLEKHHWIY